MGIVRGANALLEPAKQGTVFGVRWYKNSSSPALERLEESVGKSFTPSVGSTEGVSDFDDQPIYRDIRLCNLENGVVTTYEGDPAFSRTPATGDVMVEIPRYHYKIVDTAEYRDWYICDMPREGFEVSPRHAGYDAKPEGYEKIYVGVYTNSSAYRSISGQGAQVSTSRAIVRNSCRNRGTGYFQIDYATYWTIMLLYLVEVANLDSQGSIGNGRVSTSGSSLKSGATDSIVGHTGKTTTYTGESLNPIKYRHIENLWGNFKVFLDGVQFNSADIYVCIDPYQYVDIPDDNYILLSYTRPTAAQAFIKNLGFDVRVPWAQYPMETGGSSGTYFADYAYYVGGQACLSVGGYFSVGVQGGIFCSDGSAGYNSANSVAASRLIHLPQV